MLDDWTIPYLKGKSIEEQLPEMRSEVFEKCKAKYPYIKYKNYGGLRQGVKYKKLDDEIIDYVQDDINKLISLDEEAKELIEKSNKLLSEKQNIESINNKLKRTLNPKTDEIPKDIYPKLSNCNIYPLRHSCNFGSNEISSWERCEYMKYDNSVSSLSSNRWQCTFSND